MPMEPLINISENYASMSSAAADGFFNLLASSQTALICPASGDSPTGLYTEIVTRTKAMERPLNTWRFIGLDEWVGMDGRDEGSCRNYLNKQLFVPLGIPEERICFFDGRSTKLDAECKSAINYIQEQGGIDIAIVGLGMNGHIGFNEPGVSPLLKAHVIELQKSTQQVGQKYFNHQPTLSQGITLGLASIVAARNIIMVVSGQHKAPIVQKMLQQPMDAEIPARLLRQHPRLRIYLDKAAASLL